MPRRWPLLYLAAAAVFASLIRFTISHGFRPDSWRCNRTFTCGGLTGNLNFPFWPDSPTNSHVDPYCDVPGFGLIGCSGPGSYPLIYLGGYYFRVLQVNQSIGSMTVVHKDLWDSTPANCQWNFSSEWKLDDHNLLRYSETNLNLNLSYNCPYNAAFNSPWKNVLACGGREAWWFKNSDVAQPHGCEGSFNFTVNRNAYEALQNGSVGLWGAVRIGFDLEFDFDSVFCFTCKSFPEKCERDSDSVGAPKCKLRGSQKWKRKLAIGLGCGLGGIAILGIICYCFLHHKKTSHRISTQLSRRTWSGHSMATNNNENGECFPGVHQFTYSELVQATDNFNPARALGDGGFGTVYYGKLQDERAVAVKRLYENNYRRVERFMNEVEILARLRHKNLVVLYGCTSRHSRELLLVYEYIPNGTVADHLHGERAEPGALPWPIRLKIAIETASALVYLHASGIIHRDVKTNNILLDNNFIVKVADFGLSRLFPTHVTHVSTVPQGTPGYVDPEYHQCYQLTEKSDVYSFGVVLVELISSMPAVDVNRQRHEINLATMAINKIQNRALHELVDPSVEFESDYRVRKMIAAVAEVAFQCLQHDRDMRPSMVYVLQVLRGIESEQYNEGNVEEMDVLVDEVVLLKSGPLPLSPDSMCSGRASGLISTTEARACDARDSSHVEEDASEYPSQ